MIAALLLAGSSIVAWFTALGAKAAARVQIRFAAVLFASLAVAAAVAPNAASAIALIVLPIGLSVLALASTAGFGAPMRPALAAVVLALVVIAALTAAVTSWRAFALTPAAFAIVGIAVVSLQKLRERQLAALQGLASTACFLAASSAFALDGVGTPLLLFAAAGLLGLTLALSRSDGVVEERAGRDLRESLAIEHRG